MANFGRKTGSADKPANFRRTSRSEVHENTCPARWYLAERVKTTLPPRGARIKFDTYPVRL